MSDDRRDAAEASAVDVECEPMTLRLVLSDLTVVETFRGFYEYGDRDMEVEPAHRVMIKAKWKNVWYEYGRSDQRFLLGGKEIDPEMTPLLLGGGVQQGRCGEEPSEPQRSLCQHHRGRLLGVRGHGQARGGGRGDDGPADRAVGERVGEEAPPRVRQPRGHEPAARG
jgi:hypothetical protein